MVPARSKANLGPFLDRYFAGRADVKGATIVCYGHTRRNLENFFGAEKPLREITKGDADEFRTQLIAQGLATATVARRCNLAKTFLAAAVRHEAIPRNPFEDLKGTVRANRDKMRFITPEMTAPIIEACPDHKWRLPGRPGPLGRPPRPLRDPQPPNGSMSTGNAAGSMSAPRRLSATPAGPRG